MKAFNYINCKGFESSFVTQIGLKDHEKADQVIAELIVQKRLDLLKESSRHENKRRNTKERKGEDEVHGKI